MCLSLFAFGVRFPGLASSYEEALLRDLRSRIRFAGLKNVGKSVGQG